jgi:hypothetical protein
MRRHPTAPVNVAGISVATSGTDFTALNAISQRLSGLSVRKDHIRARRELGSVGIHREFITAAARWIMEAKL